MSIISILVVSLFSTFTRSMTRDRSASESTNVAAVGMSELTRVLRSGTEIRRTGNADNIPVFLFAGRESLIMHGFLDTSSASPKPVKVQFAVNSQRQLMETRWNSVAASNPYWTFASAVASNRRIASKIVVRTGTDPWLFTYRTAAVCAATLPNCNVITVPSTGITDPNVLKSIALVEVRLQVQADSTGRAAPVLLTNQVGLPNRGIDRVGASR